VSSPVLLALLAAVLFAVANNLQRHAAARVPAAGFGPVRLILRLLRSPRWLAGGLSATVALLAQVRALTQGGVILVQAVIASTLIFSLTIEAAVERRRPSATQVGGSAAVALGITLLVGLGKPGVGGDFSSLWRAVPAWAAVGVAGGVALTLAHQRPKGRLTAMVLGAAAGVCFALDAVFLRGLAGTLSRFDTVTELTDAAGFAAASVLGNLVIQRAFQIAPLRHVLPAMAAAEPMAAFACGRILFGERLQSGPTGVLAVTGGLAMMAAGVVLCSIRPPQRRPTGPVQHSRRLRGATGP
jgi:drug/metabolite transporter (DMT)-like permease